MKPLSILHTESSLGWGGQEIRILTEARGMLDRGHRVTLLTPAEAEIFPAAKRAGIPVEAVDIAKKRFKPLLTLRNWLRAHGSEYDVINTHSSTDTWLAAVACATLQGMPALVRTRHVSTAVNNHFSTRWLYEKATAHIVTTGEALRQQLHGDNGYPLEHMTSVRTGIALDYYRPLDKSSMRTKLGLENRPTIGIVATLRDWKGHEDLLDAMVLLRTQSGEFGEWRLAIVGDGPEFARLETKIAARQLGDVVKLVGNQNNVPEWLSAFDIFTLPSYGNEGVPQGIMQAMACGLPVVCTSVGAISEAVQDGHTGIMVATRNPQALADGLAALMRDTQRRTTMGGAGHAFAQEHFGVNVMLDKMEAVFRRCARA
ncbi:MAG: glycosyltransferase family 4 protein [Usitatibacteraceae bacterium]